MTEDKKNKEITDYSEELGDESQWDAISRKIVKDALTEVFNKPVVKRVLKRGNISFENGDEFEGDFFGEDFLVDGGTYTFSDGSKYIGQYKNGVPYGHGSYTYSDGTKYVGEHSNGTFEGQGEFTDKAGKRYVGGFKNGKPHGKGTYFNEAQDVVFEGEYQEGVACNGIVNYPNGDKYEGELLGQLEHGNGIYTNADGRKYIGEFKNGSIHGKGTYTGQNGYKFVGNYRNGEKYGDGTIFFSSGAKFVAFFNDDQSSEKGVLHRNNGKEYKYQMVRGKLVPFIPILKWEKI